MPYKEPFKLGELASFLMRARATGYAGGAKEVSNPQRPGFKEFPPYREGDFEYIDSYSGFYQAPGQEVVRYKGKPAWHMAYSGGMLPEFHGDLAFAKQIYGFLRKALARPNPQKPFRGPARFAEGDFEYLDDNEGDLADFNGVERITCKGREVFRQRYIGGRIVHKE